MHIATIIAAVCTAACTSLAYIHYASTVNRDQHIPFLHRIPNIPLRVDLVCCPVWSASGALLCLALPVWPGLAIYCAAALLPWEIMRHRHNHRLSRPTPSINPSGAA
ncbi:hypothetical protein [Streptomyces sp. NPDC059566]|uniref:hypothetical protein n=1 Tax=Streptomyces sp. NPDC059566 TaxID=3346866 RepID=UPI0036B44E6C